MRALFVALLLPACSTYQVIPGKDGDVAAGDDTAPVANPAEDACDGLDDDGDGQADDGFGDHDADGVADCVDDACSVTVEPGGTAEAAACAQGVPEVTDAWRTRTLWEWDGGDRGFTESYNTPLVAQFDDDDGDGDIDSDDDVDIAILAGDGNVATGALVLLDGPTGEQKWRVQGIYFGGGTALADLDVDGQPELLAFNQLNELSAFAADGALLWTSRTTTPAYLGGMPNVAVADLDGDGAPEVLANHLILEGTTGRTLHDLPIGDRVYFVHAIGDLDGDGASEIVFDGSVYTADGTLLWTAIPTGAGSYFTPPPLILNADTDPEGEVVFVDEEGFHLYDTDGTVLADAPGPGGDGAPPCAGDFDGDGVTEVAVPYESELWLYELDGTVVWAAPTQDLTGASGCSGFDADGDGSVEIVYADERDLWILDGATGDALVTLYDHGSGTFFEYPTITDLDHDGHAELLVANSEDTVWGPLVALQHDGPGWTAVPETWAAHDRVPGRFGPTGEVYDPGAWWQTENTFRTIPSTHQPSTEARLEGSGSCVSACAAPGVVEVGVRVGNSGEAEIAAGMELNLYRLDGVVQTWLATTTLPEALAAGETSATITLRTGAENIGLDGLVVRLNEDRLAIECDETDNAVYFSDLGC